MSLTLGRTDRSRKSGPASLVLVLSALVLAAVGASPVRAVPGLELSTPFPAVVVEPGDSATFPLTIDVDDPRRVDVSVTGLPEGWTSQVRGGGLVVDAVFVDPDAPPEVELAIDVPDGATGTASPTVTVRSGNLTDTLDLDLRIEEQAAGDVSLETDFAELSGASDQTFSFDVTLRNDTPGEATFGLTTSGAPEGWDVSARPSGEDQATTVTVDAGSTETISVSVDPDDDAAAQTYPITLQAAGDAGTASIDLNVIITGSYTLQLSTPNDVLSATANAGAAKELQFEVTNAGTAPITAIELTASTPTGWTFTGPEVLPALAPNETQTLTATLVPTNEAVAGDYVVTVTAAGAEADADVQLRVTVETSPIWGLLGVALIAAVLGGLFWVFRTYGRR